MEENENRMTFLLERIFFSPNSWVDILFEKNDDSNGLLHWAEDKNE